MSGGSHLGSWLSALADGQLAPAETERALSHVAVCLACARELDAARAARRALSSARDVVPDPALVQRLMALQASIPPADSDPLRSPLRPGPAYAGAWAPAYAGDADYSGNLARRARRGRAARLAAFGAGGLGMLGLTLFALGDAPVVSPDLSPQESMTILGRAGQNEAAPGEDVLARLDVGGQGTTAEALAWVAENGWVAPTGLPDGFQVSALRLLGDEGQVLEIDLTGPHGTAVVRQQVGRLRAGVTAGTGTTAAVSAVRVPDHDVVLLAQRPAHVAWQADDVVVDVLAEVPDDVLADLVAAFPGRGYDAGVLPRIARGWTNVTGAIASP